MKQPAPMTAESRKALARDFVDRVWDYNPDLRGYAPEVADAMRRAPLAYFRGCVDSMKASGSSEIRGAIGTIGSVALALHGDIEALLLLVPLLRSRVLLETVRLVCFLLPIDDEGGTQTSFSTTDAANWIDRYRGRILFDALSWCYRITESSPDTSREPVGSGRVG